MICCFQCLIYQSTLEPYRVSLFLIAATTFIQDEGSGTRASRGGRQLVDMLFTEILKSRELLDNVLVRAILDKVCQRGE